MSMQTRKVTITDVAREAGVSRSAVSYALNDKPGVSRRTKEKVLAVAASMGWKPNRAAKALSDASTRSIGIILTYRAEALAVDSYSMELLAGLGMELEKNDYSLLLRILPDGSPTVGIHRDWIASGSVDGVIITNVEIGDPRVDLYCEHPEMPVLALAEPSITKGLPTMTSDDTAGARLIVDYLHELGHRNIARVAGPERIGHTFIRDRAFTDETAALGMQYACLHADYSPDQGAECTKRLLTLAHPPTAIVYDSDAMAVSGLHVAQSQGIVVPTQLSIVSWDDSYMCENVAPALTALWRDVTNLGAKAVPLLLRQINGEHVQNALESSYQLVTRDSTAPAPAAAD